MAAFTVYWQPGCSSCLRAKEFLTANGVDFVSVNVREDIAGAEALTKSGIMTVPIVTRGDDYVHGQDLDELARFIGVDPKREKLPADELAGRIGIVLNAASRYVRQIPDDVLTRPLPGRDRTALDLAYHVAMVVRAFLDATEGGSINYEHFERRTPSGAKAKTVGFVLQQTAAEFARWYASAEKPATLRTYYGPQPFHNILERTCWHTAQHTRQLMTLVSLAGLAPDGPLASADFAGLPMPQEIYDDQVKLAG